MSIQVTNAQSNCEDSKFDKYVSFLNTQNTSAKDYVLQLFEKYNIVILCERDHRDMTQYNLIYDIVSDERFLGGNIFIPHCSFPPKNQQFSRNFEEI
jgi:hypothetical protein